MRTNVLAAFFTAAVESASGSIEGMVPFPQAASFVDVGHRPTLAPMRQKERTAGRWKASTVSGYPVSRS